MKRTLSDQQKLDIDAALRALRKRSLNERELRETPPKLADLESASLERDRETAIPKITASDQEEAPRREPKQSDEPVRRQSADRSESLETPQGEASAKSGYDSRDDEIGRHVAGLKQEKFRREKRQSDVGMRFAKAGASFIGRMIGSRIGQATGGMPHDFKSPLMAAAGEMFGGSESGRAESGVPMFGEGMDAAVSSDGGGGAGGNGDLNAKLDRIIELLSQLVQASGSGVTGPQADTAFAAGDVGHAMARQMGQKAVQAATGASINDSNKGSSSDDMMGVLLQTLMRAAMAAI